MFFFKIWHVSVVFLPKKMRLSQGCGNLIHHSASLLKRVLAQPLATQGQVLHVARHLLAEVLVHIQLGEVLAEHEAVAAQAGEDADLRVDDVTRLGVTTSPASQEAHLA